MQLPPRKTLKGFPTAAPAYLPQAPRGGTLDTARQQKIKGAAHQALEALVRMDEPPAGTPAAAAGPADTEPLLAVEKQAALGSSGLDGSAGGTDAARGDGAAALGSSGGDQHTGGVVKQLQYEAEETGAAVSDEVEALQPVGGWEQPAAGLRAGAHAWLLGSCCVRQGCGGQANARAAADAPAPVLHQPLCCS